MDLTVVTNNECFIFSKLSSLDMRHSEDTPKVVLKTSSEWLTFDHNDNLH